MALKTGSLVDTGASAEAGLSPAAVARGRNASCTARKQAAAARKSLGSRACAEPRGFRDSEMYMKSGLPYDGQSNSQSIRPNHQKRRRIRVCLSVWTRANQ